MAFYFGWMNFYSTYMIVPAVVGLMMYMFRPSGITVDTDPYLPFFSVFMAIWAVLFVVVSVGKGVVFPGGEIGLMQDSLKRKSGLAVTALWCCATDCAMCDSHRHYLVDLGLGK